MVGLQSGLLWCWGWGLGFGGLVRAVAFALASTVLGVEPAWWRWALFSEIVYG